MASNIDPTCAGQLTTRGLNVQKSEVQEQFQAAKTEIEALQTSVTSNDTDIAALVPRVIKLNAENYTVLATDLRDTITRIFAQGDCVITIPTPTALAMSNQFINIMNYTNVRGLVEVKTNNGTTIAQIYSKGHNITVGSLDGTTYHMLDTYVPFNHVVTQDDDVNTITTGTRFEMFSNTGVHTEFAVKNSDYDPAWWDETNGFIEFGTGGFYGWQLDVALVVVSANGYLVPEIDFLAGGHSGTVIQSYAPYGTTVTPGSGQETITIARASDFISSGVGMKCYARNNHGSLSDNLLGTSNANNSLDLRSQVIVKGFYDPAGADFTL